MKKLFKRVLIAGIIFTLCAFVLTRQTRTKQSIAPLPREKIEYEDYLENISSDMLKYSSSSPMIHSPWQRLKMAVSMR